MSGLGWLGTSACVCSAGPSPSLPGHLGSLLTEQVAVVSAKGAHLSGHPDPPWKQTRSVLVGPKIESLAA